MLFAASLFEPRVFRFVLGGVLRCEAWRHGVTLDFDRIGGSFFEPVTLAGSRWSFHGEADATTRFEIAKVEAKLVWKNLLPRTTARWFQRLSITGVQGKVILAPAEAAKKGRRRGWLSWRPSAGHWALVPAAVEGRDIDFIVESEADYLRVEECGFTASDVAPGELHAGRVTIKQPWLSRTFKNVRGTTAMQGAKFILASVSLEPGVEIRSLSAELPELARGRLNLDLQLAAFDGSLHAEAATVPRDGGLVFEAGGQFAQISIAKLAGFLALSDAAGGTIKEGNFSFRGSPHDPAKATAKLRLDAVNFQWETRQWDSLTLGLLLMDGRLQVPQFDLHQGKNTLTVSGELALPGADERWWQGEFNCAIKARIGNLTELSALFLPEFKYAAGGVRVDGNIRGKGEEFYGQLLVEGTKLTWRNAPIETLHAAVKLDGRELKVARVELVNGDDFLRGSGVVNLFGPTQYWGELRVSAVDLASYAAFLQKPVLPEPLAGGAIIDWTGEGSAAGHSGKFMARLRKVRTVGALAQQFHPINADIEASYVAGTMLFTKFVLSDDDSSLTANIAVGNKALNVSGIRLLYRQQLQLEGDALLPFDVWQQWPDVSLDQLLTDDVVSRVNLTAHALDLEQASQLTGWVFPVAGILDGTLSVEGAIGSLKLGGSLRLAHARIPLGWSGEAIDEAHGEFTFADDSAQIVKLGGRHPYGELEIAGTVRLANPRDPELDLALRSPQATLPVFRGSDPGVTVDAGLDLRFVGPLSSASVTGQAKILSLAVDAIPDLTPLWRAEHRIEVPPLFSLDGTVGANWSFDIACQPAEADGLKNGASVVRVDLHVGGLGAEPALTGRIELGEVEVAAGTPALAESDPIFFQSLIAHVALDFFPEDSAEPSLDIELRGSFDAVPFHASATGPLNHLMRVYSGNPPLTEETVRALLAGKLALPGDRFALRARAPIAAGVEEFVWAGPEAAADDAPK